MKLATVLFFLTFLFSFYVKAQLPNFTVTVYDSSKTSGYYFLTDAAHLLILDRMGNTVYFKPLDPGFNFTLQKNGMMTYTNLRKTYVMDSTFTIRDSIVCQNGYHNDTREMQFLPNGNALVMGDEWVMMSVKGQKNFEKKLKRDSVKVRCSIFQELDPKKKVLFEWHAKDHLSIKDVDDFNIDSSRVFSLPHISSLEKDIDGNYLVTCKWTNQVLKVNAKNGSIIWRLGGNGNQFKFIDCPIPFYGPRDGRRISNGNFTLFDGGENYKPHGYRAMEFVLDEKNKTAKLQWSYTFDPNITSNGRGNVQRLANGNTLICSGYSSKESTTFLVVNPEGKKIMNVSGPRSFRAFNYPSLPWKLHRPEITCYDSAGVSYLDAGAGYKSYLWNDSLTTRARVVKSPGVYSVLASYGDGGFFYSEKITVTNTSEPCDRLPSNRLIKSNDDEEK